MSTNAFSALADALKSASDNDWSIMARPNQIAPTGLAWLIWLILAGRGFGKTRTELEYARQQIESGAARRARGGNCGRLP
jgi:phage terminase large subunit-like protein